MATKTARNRKTTKSRRRPKVRRLTDAQRLDDIKAALQVAFILLADKYAGDAKEVANATQLHPSTIKRLDGGDVSLMMRISTFYKILQAAGLNPTYEESGEITLAVVK